MISVRRARAADRAVLALLFQRYFPTIKRIVGAQDAQAAAAAFLLPPADAWIALDGGEPAGCVALRPLRARACELKHLFVRPSHRGKGVARRLMRAVHRRARSLGYVEIFLDTLPEMMAAQALYAAEGYAECESYRADPVCRMFMRKRL